MNRPVQHHIYGYHDRFRGVKNTRDVLFMNEKDMISAGLQKRQIVALESDAEAGKIRRQGRPRPAARRSVSLERGPAYATLRDRPASGKRLPLSR
jgi:hypothetical protein